MRVLCTAIGSPSHGRALLPLARALASDGHPVTVATTATVAPVFAADDVTVVDCLPPLPSTTDDDSGLWTPAASENPRAQLDMLIEMLTGAHAEEHYRPLRAVGREVRPDLIVRDGMDVAACLLAEELGVPQLPTPSGFVNMVDPSELLPPLNRLRARLSLPERHDPASLYPHGRFDYLPPEYTFARHRTRVLAYRQTTLVDRSAGLPAWLAGLPGDRPLVFAAVGTALPILRDLVPAGTPLPAGMTEPAEVLRAIVAGLSRLDCTAVVATGGTVLGDVEPAEHVHLVDWLAQPLLLECVDLFVTHGGYNSVREAVRTGTPMAVLPNFGDQPHNAQRVQDLGLGRRVTDTSAGGIADVCRSVLADRDIAARSRRAQRAALALPDLTALSADVEEIVATADRSTERRSEVLVGAETRFAGDAPRASQG